MTRKPLGLVSYVLYASLGGLLVNGTVLAQYVSNAQRAPEGSVLGRLRPTDAVSVLELLGDQEQAGAITKALGETSVTKGYDTKGWPWPERSLPAWQHTWHAFGYIQPIGAESPTIMEIVDAGSILPDAQLKNQNIKITLDRLRVFDYPGGNVEHKILFTFQGKHQGPGNVEDLQFSQVYRAREGEGAAISGNPIFVGLTVSSEGVTLRCTTTNAENKEDEQLIAALDSPALNGGLKLTSGLNPAIPVVAGFAGAVAKAVLSRHRNVSIQDFILGLDFSNTPSRARLREGVYVSVQEPDPVWDWSRWQFNRSNGTIVSKTDAKQTIPLNYVVFSISKIEPVK